jgi:hypothetical protein
MQPGLTSCSRSCADSNSDQSWAGPAPARGSACRGGIARGGHDGTVGCGLAHIVEPSPRGEPSLISGAEAWPTDGRLAVAVLASAAIFTACPVSERVRRESKSRATPSAKLCRTCCATVPRFWKAFWIRSRGVGRVHPAHRQSLSGTQFNSHPSMTLTDGDTLLLISATSEADESCSARTGDT